MRIIYSNLFDDYTLTESQEDTNYPVENVQDIRLTEVWRTTTASAATISIDAGTGETITCDCAAILNHNFSSSALTFVQASTAATFTPTALSASVTYRSDIMVVFFTSGAYRYWRFNFSDTGNGDGYYEAGRLVLGTYLQVDPSSLVEFPEGAQRTDSVSFGITNQMYSDEGLGYKTYKYGFEYAANSMKSSIETMFGSVGMFKPIIFMNYNTTYTEIPPVYCSIIEPIEFKHRAHDKWDFNLSLRECD